MELNRRALFYLVATGRISPAEAERLFTAWNDGGESLWILALLVVAVGASQIHGSDLRWMVDRTISTLLPMGLSAWHHAATQVAHWIGEIA